MECHADGKVEPIGERRIIIIDVRAIVEQIVGRELESHRTADLLCEGKAQDHIGRIATKGNVRSTASLRHSRASSAGRRPDGQWRCGAAKACRG